MAGKHRTKGAQLSGVEGDYESSVERERAQNSQSSSKPQGGGRRGGGGGGAPRTGSNSGGAQGDGGIGERRGGRSRGLRVNGGTAPGGNGDGGANGGPATTSASVQSSKRDQRERQPRSARTGRPVGEKPAEPTQLGKRPSSMRFTIAESLAQYLNPYSLSISESLLYTFELYHFTSPRVR